MTEASTQAAELELLKAGDPGAQARFLRAHQSRVQQICRRIVGANVMADDLAEDVLIDFLFSAVQRIDRGETMVAYLQLMAARQALRQRDRRARHEPISAELPDPQSKDPLEALALARAGVHVARCLEELTPKARWVLKLRFDADLTQEHIGRVAGGSKQYIGRLITRSLDALRRCLELRGVPKLGGEA